MLTDMSKITTKLESLVLEGKYITARPLTMSHENLLSKNFSPDLFEFFPYKYIDCHDFISNILKSKENGNFFPWVLIRFPLSPCNSVIKI